MYLPTLHLSDSFTYGVSVFMCLHCYGEIFLQMPSILASAFLSFAWLLHVWCILTFFIFWYQCSNETHCSCKVGHLWHRPLKRINNSSSLITASLLANSLCIFHFMSNTVQCTCR